MQDLGTCAEASQPRQVNAGGKPYTLVSFLEPGTRTATDRVTQADIDAVDTEIARLQANRCYRLCVRMRATGAGINQALGSCDLVFIIAHGSATKPFVELGGDPKQSRVKPPPVIAAASIWIAACHGQEIVAALNGPQGAGLRGKRLSTLPAGSFYKDGTVGRHDMIQGLVAELKKLNATQCDAPSRVCILSGVQEVVQR